MSVEDCKFTYFGLAGRGEATRLALSIGNVKFTDERIKFPEWKELKPNTPWGSLPILTLSDGTVIAQQRAILRFVGKKTGLYPTDDVAAALVDGIMDAVEDIGALVMSAGKGLEQTEKEAARKAAAAEGGGVYAKLSKIDNMIAANGKDGVIVGDVLTIADLFVHCNCNHLVSGMFDGIPADAIDEFANITALRKMVRSNPAVCKWYDELDSSIKMPAAFGAFT